MQLHIYHKTGISMSSRLRDIKSLLEDEYEEIWDTCCDHGKLGLLFLNSPKVNKIHFIDCVPGIIKKLELKLKKNNLEKNSKLTLNCIDAGLIQLTKNKSLICICGVGGETAIEITKKLLTNNQLKNHDIIYCVQYHTFELREFLIKEGFKSKKELLCFEGKWAHEILLVNQSHGIPIDSVGKNIFNLSNTQHDNHLKKIITHYENKSLNDPSCQNIKKRYQQIK